MNNRKDQMHPDDMRNLFIFMIISVLLWLAYDVYVLGPQKEALKQAKTQQVQLVDQGEDNNEKKVEPVERAAAIAQSARIQIDNGKMFGSLSLKGGRFDDLSFYDYFETLEKRDHVSLLSPKATVFPRMIEYGWVAGDESVNVPDVNTFWSVEGDGKLTKEHPVTLVWDNGQGLTFRRVISVDNQYVFTVTQGVRNRSAKKVQLFSYGLISQTGIPKEFQGSWILHEGPIGFVGDALHEVTYKSLRKDGSQKFQGSKGWIGITDKYWLTAIIPQQGESFKYSYEYTGEGSASGRYQADIVGAALEIAPGETVERTSHVFTGPKKVLMLEAYAKSLNAPKFDLAVNFGWFWFFSKPFFYILHFLGLKIGNMGFAIILLTLMIRFAVFPLTNASYRSFGAMKKVQPQIAALRETYGSDKAKLQKELIELYQREGVNPMAGCLPILLQIPIFFALYKVLYVTIEIRQAPFIGWIHDLSAPDPTTVFNLFGLIDWQPPAFLMIGVWPCVMLVATIIQKKLNPPPQDPIQRDMANYFPFIMCYVMSKFPSGLVIYWAFSAWAGVVQQMVIMKGMGIPIHLFGETEEEKAMDAAIDKGPAVHPLMEMVEEDVEDALFGAPESPTISPPKKGKKSKKKKK